MSVSKQKRRLKFENFVKESEVSVFLKEARKFVAGERPVNSTFAVFVVAILPLTFIFNAFVFLIPMLHGIGGYFLYKKDGWSFFQPGRGGARFIALNAVGWAFYGFTILFQLLNLIFSDIFLSISGFFSGLLSLSFIFSSLFAFQGKHIVASIEVVADKSLKEEKIVYDTRLRRSVIKESGETPSGLFWVLIGLQISLCITGSWVMFFLASTRISLPPLEIITFILADCCFIGSTPITHAIGGKWKNYGKTFRGYQPFVGGKRFISLQAVGWFCYAISQLFAIFSIVSISSGQQHKSIFLILTALLASFAEMLIIISLFYFEDDISGQSKIKPKDNKFADLVMSQLIKFSNAVFSPKGNWKAKTRQSTIKSPEDWKKGEELFEEIIKDKGISKQTNEQYLIVGCGFVGKRLVKRLLERGETRIRVFDLNPVNPFKGVKEVEYIVGNVTKFQDIFMAAKGADTVYATFALIRFMDRLSHQAPLSYHVNVVGTQVLFDALFESAEISKKTKDNPLKVIVTSSSHATTDEHSLPRKNRTESAEYVTKETAHNHYGWTKALADKYVLKEGSSNERVKTTVVRPCSGVFGGDDRTSMQKCLNLGVAPGIGSYCEMDWIYVENVVLGHLLAESGLVKEIRKEIPENSVHGQAFNVSNNDATTWIDFWHLVKDTIEKTQLPMKIEYCFVPMTLIWGAAYFSETVQRLFKGRIKLGQDLDTLTPAMLSTATMSYTYNSDKAKKVLGYIPAFTLDEGVQKGVIEYYELFVKKSLKTKIDR